MKTELKIKVLQDALDNSNQMWSDEKSAAYIVGYLQGTIKIMIQELLNEIEND